MTAKIISIKENPFTLYLLVAGIVCSALCYIYCVNASVRNVVAREEIDAKAAALRNEVGELEYAYINMESGITLDSAKNYGLSEPAQKVFISRDGSGRTLSVNKP